MSAPIELEMRDGTVLRATLHESPGAEDLLLVAPAMAVPARRYAAFAEHCRGQGLSVLLLDYRGVEGNREGHRDASITDWCRDIDDVVRRLRPTYPRVHFLGHSVGAQIFGLLEEASAFEGVVFVCASSGTWWKHKGLSATLKAAFFILVYIPASVALFGYAHARLVGMGVEIPRGAALEWVRWCRHPSYIAGHAHRYASFRHPEIEREILNVTVADDDIATRGANAALKAIYARATFVDVVASGRPMGHVGYFRSGGGELWARVTDYLVGSRTRPSS